MLLAFAAYILYRHPQAVGELPFWWVLAFLLHSPFLVLFSLVWIPGPPRKTSRGSNH
ncbi:hypothetical protein ES703_53573 [subsurface metagenome]